MKLAKIILVAIFALGTYSATAQTGTLTFVTTGGAPGQGEIFDLAGNPMGTQFLAQIYTSPTLNGTFVPTDGGPVQVGTTQAGYISAGTTVRSPNVGVGETGYYEVRVWIAAAGPTYEQASTVQGAQIGVVPPTLASAPFGGPSASGPSVNNFQNFSLVIPEPSTLVLGLVGGIGLMVLRRRH